MGGGRGLGWGLGGRWWVVGGGWWVVVVVGVGGRDEWQRLIFLMECLVGNNHEFIEFGPVCGF